MSEQIEIVQENSKTNIVMDMSMFDLFCLCPEKYNIRHNKLKAPTIEQKSNSLDTGSVLHEGYEVYYRLLGEGQHFNDRVHAAIKRMDVFTSDIENSNLEPDEVAKIKLTAMENLEYWRFEDESLEILAVEQPFAYELFSDDFIRIIITGKIDLLVNKPGIGGSSEYKNLPIDHKTFSRDFPVYRLSNQFLNYVCATESNYLLVNRVGLQKSLKSDQKFKRLPLSYDPLIKEDWKKNVKDIILRNYLECVASQTWPMNFTSCLKFNRLCEYYEICDTSGQEAKLYKLESDFATVSPWDVTAKFSKRGE